MLLAAASAAERRELINIMLQQFDGKGQRPAKPNAKISREELAVDAESFANADLDDDGQLDYEELGQFIRRPRPFAVFIVDLELSAAKRLSVDRESAAAKTAEHRGGRFSLSIGETELELSIRALPEADLESLREIFADADADSNGYLDQEETEQAATLEGLDRILDATADGKMYLAEFATFSSDTSLVNSHCIRFAGDPRGANLLQLFDSNGDGQLGFRELDKGVIRLARWNIDNSGDLSRSELPLHTRLTIAPATLAPMRAETIDSTSSNTPTWFTRMDKTPTVKYRSANSLAPFRTSDDTTATVTLSSQRSRHLISRNG